MSKDDNLALHDIAFELIRAREKFPPMRSAHEGYAILLEEVGELWEEVQLSQKQDRRIAMRKEAIQVAAMALRFIEDLCDAPENTVRVLPETA